jgi:Tol biopolymer transport system component
VASPRWGVLAVLLTSLACAGAAPSVLPRPDDRPPRPASPVAPPAPSGPANPAAPPVAGTPVGAVSLDGRFAYVVDDGVAVTEAGRTTVVYRRAAGAGLKDPTWSPDGRSIAFAHAPAVPRPQPGAPVGEGLLSSDILAVDADGANLRTLVEHEAPGQITESPAWSPDGKAVLYGFYAPTYQGNQFVSETVEVRRRELGAGQSTTVERGASNPAISRDGRAVAVVGEDPALGPSLRVLPAGGGPPRTLVPPGRFVSLLAPRFSPDGQTLAFSAAEVPGAPPKAAGPLDRLLQLVGPATAHAHDYPWEVWTVPVAGGPPRQLTQVRQDTPYLAWSADGGRVLVYGANGLHLVDAAGGRAQLLSPEGSHGGMDWRSG